MNEMDGYLSPWQGNSRCSFAQFSRVIEHVWCTPTSYIRHVQYFSAYSNGQLRNQSSQYWYSLLIGHVQLVHPTCLMYHQIWHQTRYSTRSAFAKHVCYGTGVSTRYHYSNSQFQKLIFRKALDVSGVGSWCALNMSGASRYVELDQNGLFLYLGLFIPPNSVK